MTLVIDYKNGPFYVPIFYPGTLRMVVKGVEGDNIDFLISNIMGDNVCEIDTAVESIKCRVLQNVAKNCYGEFLPEGVFLIDDVERNSILVFPQGQTDLPVEVLEVVHEEETLLVDYIWADYEKELLISKAVPAKEWAATMVRQGFARFKL